MKKASKAASMWIKSFKLLASFWFLNFKWILGLNHFVCRYYKHLWFVPFLASSLWLILFFGRLAEFCLANIVFANTLHPWACGLLKRISSPYPILQTFSVRAFSVTALTLWSSLTPEICSISTLDTLKQCSKCTFSSRILPFSYWHPPFTPPWCWKVALVVEKLSYYYCHV